jgi:hypothetical protein
MFLLRLFARARRPTGQNHLGKTSGSSAAGISQTEPGSGEREHPPYWARERLPASKYVPDLDLQRSQPSASCQDERSREKNFVHLDRIRT